MADLLARFKLVDEMSDKLGQHGRKGPEHDGAMGARRGRSQCRP